MRADRLLTILMLLQTRGRMTARELAERLEVSERTIYRDMEALSIAGIPIYAERGPGGGCELLDGYKTTLTGLTPSEIQALFTALDSRSLADLGLAQALDEARLKLLTALPETGREHAEQARQRVHIDHKSWFAGEGHGEHLLPIIQQALYQERKLYIRYRMDDGASVEREFAPYGLVSKAGAWFLIGASHELSVVAVASIQCIELTETGFTYPQGFDLERYWETYCRNVEERLPLYARPLHLAPYEARHLPHVLGEWGYTLQENNLDLEPVVVPGEKNAYASARQEKKAASPSTQLAVQRNDGSWLPLRHKKKSYVLPSMPTAKKKKNSLPSNLEQASRQKKKNGFNSPFVETTDAKKKNAISPSHGFQAATRKKTVLISPTKKTQFPAA